MIVIVEDDRNIRELVLYTLRNFDFESKGYVTGKEFFENYNEDKPKLLLLDIMLPEEDGISILKKIRSNEDMKNLPVIMLTAKDTEFDKIVGLDSGADDYVTKPFSMLELNSRIKAILRRTKTEESPANVLKYKFLTLDDESHKVYIEEKSVEMTLKEYNTLKLLLSKKGKVVTRDELLNTVWGYDFTGETRTVDVHIRTIRAKLGEFGGYIETVRGVGYKIGGNDD